MRIWLFDFDGTLSSLVSDRNAAVMHPACIGMLKGLSQSPTDRVAIISSRALEDILPRVPLVDVIIGGNSGIEWQLPGGLRFSPGASKEEILQARRKLLMPHLERLCHKPGIEIEDKQWSVAIHIKESGHDDYEDFAKTIAAWADQERLSMHRGPKVLEIQFFPGFNKSIGASFLTSLLKIDTQKDSIIYAGDDENDAVAMLWTLLAGGTAIIVGSRLDVPGAIYVKDQQELVDAVKVLRENGDTLTNTNGSHNRPKKYVSHISTENKEYIL